MKKWKKRYLKDHRVTIIRYAPFELPTELIHGGIPFGKLVPQEIIYQGERYLRCVPEKEI